jgi:predicted  nucleic acid-binding Zn-ribbon protein
MLATNMDKLRVLDKRLDQLQAEKAKAIARRNAADADVTNCNTEIDAIRIRIRDLKLLIKADL